MKKRGISPILATVLLVGFTIAIAGVVTSFLISETKDKFNPENIITESEFCDNVALGYEIMVNDFGESQAKQSPSGTMTELTGVKLKNKGSFSIRNITIIGLDSNNVDLYIVDDDTGDTLVDGLLPTKSVDALIKFRGSYDSSVEENIIKIMPWIRDPKKKEYVLCADRALILNLNDILA